MVVRFRHRVKASLRGSLGVIGMLIKRACDTSCCCVKAGLKCTDMCTLSSCTNREDVADDEEMCCDGEDDDCKDD